ncbi:c-type cytochrome [Egibacter rhizosphaerae]|uniref:Cytochrome c oxidase subunit 2 n=1 Tax=Egibacter rhizosphaerae TaxID=1670831 RepID=A0A411YAP4_9ACTN|nr:cytochrome c oxidase subunit II [Egibacter rhizosphaerae]QBI18290.1 c-type cytochrome [Egibacter rhizosphaerae]
MKAPATRSAARGPVTGPTRGRWRRGLLRAAVLGLLVSVLAACAPDAPQDTFDTAGPFAEAPDQLWNIVFPIAVGVFILVNGILIFAIVRFRRRSDEDDSELPRQVAGNTRLEILWTLVPAVILAVIAVPTIQTTFDLAAQPDDALEVRVVAKQYWFEFEYLGDEGQDVVTSTQLHIPTEQPVYLHMEALSAQQPDPGGVGPKEGGAAEGVLHSFWVPRLAGKQDIVPGQVRNMSIQADEVGRYEGQCAQFCGLSHSRMRFQVIAQEPDEFQAWLDEQSEPAEPADEADEDLVAEGEQAFTEAACIQCHAIEGYEGPDGQAAEVRIGPDLTHFATRDTMAGGFRESNRENLRAWLEDPQEFKPGAQMPNLIEDEQMDPEQVEPLVEYLMSLE